MEVADSILVRGQQDLEKYDQLNWTEVKIEDNKVLNILNKCKRATSQPKHDVLGTSPEGPLKVLMSGIYREPSGGSQGTNTKIDDLMKKLFFRGNSACVTHLFLFFTGRTSIHSTLNSTFIKSEIVHW